MYAPAYTVFGVYSSAEKQPIICIDYNMNRGHGYNSILKKFCWNMKPNDVDLTLKKYEIIVFKKGLKLSEAENLINQICEHLVRDATTFHKAFPF